tara:strand:- start:7494 stop:8087 length:594 start_codon:yes stop_codon:yes gene_type:complete
MSYWWDISKIKGWNPDKRCIDGYPLRRNTDSMTMEDMEYLQNPITELITTLPLIIGIPSITEKNYKDFWLRHFQFGQAVNGFLYFHKDIVNGETPDGDPIFSQIRVKRVCSLKEIQDHIGFVSNADKQTKAFFKTHLFDNSERYARTVLSRIEREMEGLNDVIPKVKIPITKADEAHLATNQVAKGSNVLLETGGGI